MILIREKNELYRQLSYVLHTLCSMTVRNSSFSFEDEPFTMLNTTALGNMTVSEATGQYFTFDQLHGYCVDLARLICEQKLEIPCKFRIVKDNSFGNKPTNSQPWTGMVGELVRHEVDLAIAPLTITSQRESVVDFSKPWMNLGISILISKPEKIAPGRKGLCSHAG